MEIGKDIRKNPVVTVSILPSDFWTPNDKGLLGLRSQPGIDVSYYIISPENYSSWIHQLPSDIHGKKGDKSTIDRIKWYKAKVRELTSKKGEWTRLLQARKALDNAMEKCEDSHILDKLENTLYQARKDFIHAAPTEGPMREMQAALYNKLVRNKFGGLASQFSANFGMESDGVTPVYVGYRHTLELLGSDKKKVLKLIDEALYTTDMITSYDEVLYSVTKSKSRSKHYHDVTGNDVEFYSSRQEAMELYDGLRKAIAARSNRFIGLLLDPRAFNVPTDLAARQLESGIDFIRKTQDPSFIRTLTMRDTDDFTGRSLKFKDFREMGSPIISPETRSEILHGMEQFQMDTVDKTRDVRFKFRKNAPDVLRRYLTVKITDKEGCVKKLSSCLKLHDNEWREILANKKGFVKKYTSAKTGKTYEFDWVRHEIGESNGQSHKSMSAFSYYFFRNRIGDIDFSTLRNTGDKLSFPINSFGQAWFLIVDDLLHNLYEAPKKAANRTLKNLRINKWIKKDRKTGEWVPGLAFEKLLKSLDPDKFDYRENSSKINSAAKQIMRSDQTGWTRVLVNLSDTISKVGGSNQTNWVQKILRGAPYDSKVRDDRSNSRAKMFYSKNQLDAVRSEFIFMIRNISEYVGPEVVKFSKSWRFGKRASKKPALNHGIVNLGSWIKILNNQEANLLKTIKQHLVKHNYNLPPNYYHELFELDS